MRIPMVTLVTGAARGPALHGLEEEECPTYGAGLLESGYGLSCHPHAAIAVDGNVALPGSRNPPDPRIPGLSHVCLRRIGHPQGSAFDARSLQPIGG